MRQAPTAFVYSEMNVTPFIDVLLVLLVIFMLLNLFGRTTIRAQVPPPTGASPGTTLQLVLELPASGAYAINGQPIPKAELGTQLQAVFVNRSPSVLFVSAAPTRRYQEVMEAMDIARGAGVQVVALMPAATEGHAPGAP